MSDFLLSKLRVKSVKYCWVSLSTFLAEVAKKFSSLAVREKSVV